MPPDENVPEDRLYSTEHEWLLVEGDVARVGITAYAQEELGDVVFVALPDPGTELSLMGKLGEIESVKVATEIFSPAAGTVESVNEALADSPELVNEDPYGRGWLVTVRLSGPPEREQLLSADDYKALLRKLGGEEA